jgi:hypothetical protein
MANFMENTTAVLALSLIIVTLQGPVISFDIPRDAKALHVYCLDLDIQLANVFDLYKLLFFSLFMSQRRSHPRLCFGLAF